MTYNTLRVCGACSKWFAAYSSGQDVPYSQVPMYTCPKCHEKRMVGFDPQPGDRVLHVDYQHGPFSDLIVKERDGDTLTVYPLGDPERTRTEPLGALVPLSAYGSQR